MYAKPARLFNMLQRCEKGYYRLLEYVQTIYKGGRNESIFKQSFILSQATFVIQKSS